MMISEHDRDDLLAALACYLTTGVAMEPIIHAEIAITAEMLVDAIMIASENEDAMTANDAATLAKARGIRDERAAEVRKVWGIHSGWVTAAVRYAVRCRLAVIAPRSLEPCIWGCPNRPASAYVVPAGMPPEPEPEPGL